MNKQNLVIKSEPKIKAIFPYVLLFVVGILILLIILVNLISGNYTISNINFRFLAISLFSAISIILSISRLSKAVMLIIRNEKITIYYPFKLIRKEYPLTSLDYYSEKISKNDNSNGPNYIDFPFLVLEFRFKDGYQLTINSKNNTNTNIVLSFLKKMPLPKK